MKGFTSLLEVAAMMFSAYAGYAAWPWWWFLISPAAVVLFWALVLNVHGNYRRWSIGMPTQTLIRSINATAVGMLAAFSWGAILHGAIYFAAYWISN